MKIILSPAKKMNIDTDSLEAIGLPIYMERTERVLEYLCGMTINELQSLWKCNDNLTAVNYDRIREMDLYHNLTPAILSYEGIAYQYMAPAVFENEMLSYVQKHLRILSAFYGVLNPMDGVSPYRLEMQAKASVDGCKDMYEFWGDALYRGVVCDDTDIISENGTVIINLASKEYSKCIEKYLAENDRYITITFCEKSGKAGCEKLVTKGTYAKMARGEMVRYMAELQIENPEDIKGFDRLSYEYRDELSSDSEYVFERVKK